MFIYVIGGHAERHKIGFAKDCARRLAEFNIAHYEELELRFALEVPDGQHQAVERRAHLILADHRMRGEWFSVDAEKAIWAVNEAARQVAAGEPPPAPSEGPPEPDHRDLRAVRARLGWLWGKGRPLHREELGLACGYSEPDASEMIRGLEAEWDAGRPNTLGPLGVLVAMFLLGHLPPDGVPR